MSNIRIRWAAVGAAVAVTLGAGGIGLVGATSPSDATAYRPIAPCRIADTRSNPDVNVGDKSSPLGPEETHTIAAHGTNGECTDIPKTATGLQLNVTALNATAPTFLSVWGNGDQPNASSLNPVPGQPPTPNAVTTGLDTAGEFHIFNKFGFVDVIVDIVGLYTDHDHDDRYYTKAQTDSRLATKASTRAVYTRDDVDELLAAQRTIAASTSVDNAPDIPEDVSQELMLATIVVPASGVLQIATSIEASPLSTAWTCNLWVNGEYVEGTARVTLSECSTDGALEVGAGTYAVQLRGFDSTGDVVVGGGVLNVLFVPA